MPNYQLDFLTAQLQELKNKDYKGAVLLAVHHPPFSYRSKKGATGADSDHSSSTDMLAQIDEICSDVGIYPHAFLSGHSHNYQRYTRTITFGGKEYDVPFVQCGDGGHNVITLTRERRGQPSLEPVNGSNVDYMDPNPKVDAKSLLLEKYDDRNYGYLRVSVSADILRIGFHQAFFSHDSTW